MVNFLVDVLYMVTILILEFDGSPEVDEMNCLVTKDSLFIEISIGIQKKIVWFYVPVYISQGVEFFKAVEDMDAHLHCFLKTENLPW